MARGINRDSTGQAPLSPGPFFWVFGPLLLICLSMFVANPQCVINAELSCTRNWMLEGARLVVWSTNNFWAALARVTSGFSLIVVWLALLYHLNLTARGLRPRTPYVYMGIASAFLVPGAFYIVTKQLFSDRDIYDVSPVVQAADDSIYHLLGFRGAEDSPLLVAKELSRERWTTTLQLLHTVERPRAGDSRYVVAPAQFKAFAKQREELATLWLSEDSAWVYVVLGTHNLLVALNSEKNEVLAGKELARLSPFVLVGSQSTIDEREQHRLQYLYQRAVQSPELAAEVGLAGYKTLQASTQYEPPLAQALAISLLPLFEDHARETLELLSALKESSDSLAVRAAANDALQHPNLQAVQPRRPRRPPPDTLRDIVERRIGAD